MEKEACSDGFVVDYDVSGRVSGCCGWYLSFTTSAATHTGYDLKMCVLFPAVASRMPGDDNPYCHLYEHTFTLVRSSHML